ncbi:MAG: hypothetical protein DRJ42_31225 [Deltaproteobacteria bacterium]|nr:MAG: hypothetical protein DRJ42_31225 [Deltaproteobacteria bacterium]
MNLRELLVGEGIVDSQKAEEAEEDAVRLDRALVGVLIGRELAAEDAVADAVARAIGTVVIDVELGALDKEAVQMIPEGVARRHLLIAVARDPGGKRLRVALANPLDEAAIAAVTEATSLEVEPMVATVSGLAAAIDREYQAGSTQVIHGQGPRSEIPREDTRKMRDEDAAPGTTPGGTSPMHRLEQDAPIEQRHEALLLALVDAGILTRADYIAALRRLKGRT